MGYTVKVFDPMGLDAASAVLGADTATKSMEACAREADVLVITTPWPLFSSLDPASVQRCGKQSVIIDCWRVLTKERFQDAAKIIYLGRGDDWLTPNGIHDPGPLTLRLSVEYALRPASLPKPDDHCEPAIPEFLGLALHRGYLVKRVAREKEDAVVERSKGCVARSSYMPGG